MGEWQDISTAPKDGRSLIFALPPFYEGGKFRFKIGSFRVDEGFSGNEEPLFLDDSYDDFSTGYASVPLSRATHWMPLPSPPE